MDFKSLKEKVINFKEKTVDGLTENMMNSKFVISNEKDLEKAIEKSKNTSFVNKETGEEKIFNKYSVIIFSGKDKEFYKELLFLMPIAVTKAWSQNVFLRMCNLVDEKTLKEYKIEEIPALVLFANEKVEKIIYEEKNIKKIVKSIDFDIIKEINNF